MSRNRQGLKTARRERNVAFQKAARERGQLRRLRAPIHAAMTEAARLKRSKRRGTADFEQNMRGLGFEPLECNGRVGREIKGDVLDKYVPVAGVAA
jgi:hypothetical protein